LVGRKPGDTSYPLRGLVLGGKRGLKNVFPSLPKEKGGKTEHRRKRGSNVGSVLFFSICRSMHVVPPGGRENHLRNEDEKKNISCREFGTYRSAKSRRHPGCRVLTLARRKDLLNDPEEEEDTYRPWRGGATDTP